MAQPTPTVSVHTPTYIAAKEHASKNRVELEASDNCGCYSCFKRFKTTEIKSWIDDKQTALCPHCGLDTVLGSASPYEISDPFLRRMHQHHILVRSR